MVNDKINPEHYKSHPSGVECIDITRHHNFNVGNVIKYCWRQGLKEGETSLTDLKKAQWYLNDEIKRLEMLKSDYEFNKLKNSVSINDKNTFVTVLKNEFRFTLNYLLSLIQSVYHADEWRIDTTNTNTIISDTGCLTLSLLIDEVNQNYILLLNFKDGSSLETRPLPKDAKELQNLIYNHIKITSKDN